MSQVSKKCRSKYLLPNLEEDEIICNKCEGFGFVFITVLYYFSNEGWIPIDKPIDITEKENIQSKETYAYCKTCNGKGKLNWIENVFCK